MGTSTGRLRLAPDDHSGMGSVGGGAQTKVRPRSCPSVSSTGCEVGSTLNLYEGVDMTKTTRGPDPADRWTRNSGVNITPPTHAAPVPTTHTVA